MQYQSGKYKSNGVKLYPMVNLKDTLSKLYEGIYNRRQNGASMNKKKRININHPHRMNYWIEYSGVKTIYF